MSLPILGFFCFGILYISKQVPVSSNALRAGQPAASLTFTNAEGKQVDLFSLLLWVGQTTLFAHFAFLASAGNAARLAVDYESYRDKFTLKEISVLLGISELHWNWNQLEPKPGAEIL